MEGILVFLVVDLPLCGRVIELQVSSNILWMGLLWKKQLQIGGFVLLCFTLDNALFNSRMFWAGQKLAL